MHILSVPGTILTPFELGTTAGKTNAVASADVALMVRAVEAVDFIQWTSALRHFGLEGDCSGVRATLC